MKINSQNIEKFFVFSDTLETILKKYIHVLVLPTRIKNEDELFRIYANLIPEVTGYFGDNWDALDEILRRFEWLDYNLKEIVIFHQDIPMIENRKSLQIYLDCLHSSYHFWKTDESEPIRELKIVFPLEAREKIIEIMKDYEIDLLGKN